MNPLAKFHEPHALLEMEEKRLLPKRHRTNSIQASRQRIEHFIIEPNFKQVITCLQGLYSTVLKRPIKLAIDVETRQGAEDCIGIAWSSTECICIPLTYMENALYWTEDEEVAIGELLHKLFKHKNCLHLGQNYSYDMQYFLRDWGIKVDCYQDSMVQHHTLFPSFDKALDFLGSIYCGTYRYWKGAGKEGSYKTNSVRWIYNCRDCCITYEACETLEAMYQRAPESIQYAYRFQQYELVPALVEIMNRGVRVKNGEKARLSQELLIPIQQHEEEMNYIMEEPFNMNSPQQMQAVLYTLLDMPVQKSPTTYQVTTDKVALANLSDDYPLYRSLLNRITEYKALRKFRSTYLEMQVDTDQRMRTAYNPCGTGTFRLSSRKNAFGSGGNLQNTPTGGKTILGHDLPNIKSLMIADPNKSFWDSDFDSADLRVVAAESNCDWLNNQFQLGNKVYVELMKEFYQDDSITKDHAEYRDFKGVTHGCLTADHEVLTPNGWIPIVDAMNNGCEIAEWEAGSMNVSFATPLLWTNIQVEELYHFTHTAYDQLTSSGHRMVGKTDTRGDQFKVWAAESTPKSASLYYVGKLQGAISLTQDEIILLCSLQADGNIQHINLDGTSTVRYHFAKPRKIVRLEGALKRLGIPYTIRDTGHGSDNSAYGTNTVITFHTRDCFLTPDDKTFGWEVLQYTQETAALFIKELLFWDGSDTARNLTKSNTRRCYHTTNALHAEIVHTLTHLVGLGSKALKRTERGGNRKDIYEVSQNARTGSIPRKRRIVVPPTEVYCPKTSTGFFMVRRNGHVSVSGNTNYKGGASGLAKRLGMPVPAVQKLQDWYYWQCPEIKTWQTDLKAQVFKRGWTENVFGYRTYWLDTSNPMLMNEVTAWSPQSTIAILTNVGLVNMRHNEPEIEVLLQVHDSLAGQAPTSIPDEELKQRIVTQMEVELPFDTPIIIPVECLTGKSWADCK